jgi:hypothetical protein
VTAGKLGGCTWPGVPLPQKREDGGGDDDAEGNAGEDLRWRVITQLDPRPGDDGHQGLCGQQRLAEDQQQRGGGPGGDGGVHRDLPPEGDHPAAGHPRP